MESRRLGAVSAGVCVGLASAIALASPVPAAASPLLREFTIPSTFTEPWGITVGPDGRTWFTESDNNANRIGRVDPGTGNVTEFSIPTPTNPLQAQSGPHGIVTGPDGALWFTENGGNKIGRITTDGSLTEFPIPSANSFPSDIIVGPDGALWFAEMFGEKLGRITTGGSFSEFAVPTPNGEPWGIATGADGAIWFTEFNGNKIGRMSTAGSFSEFPIPTSGPFGTSVPLAIVGGPDGALWFTEGIGNNIGRITTAGVITEFAVPTSGSGLQGITSGPDGALWFTETDAGKLGRITTSGAITEPLTSLAGPFGIATGPGSLWIAELAGNKIGLVIPSLLSLPTFIGPVCVNGLGVSLNGAVDWGQFPVGSITLDWGDGNSTTASGVFPAAHTYAAPGPYSISVEATTSGASGSASTAVNVGPGQQTCNYAISPQPIASTGSLSAGRQVNLTVSVTDSSGNPVPGAPVWLSFQQAPGGGAASACCFFVGQSVPAPLGSIPQVLVTGVGQPTGSIALTYSAPSLLPPGGTDTITAQNAPASATVTLIDTYTFTIPTSTSLVSSPNPSQVGQSVTYTASVSPTPTGGTIGFADNGSPIAGCGALAVSGATASCSVTYASTGSQNIVATFSGFANFLTSGSPTLTEIVTATPCGVLAGCNLHSLTLTNAQLAGANLAAANLLNANLSDANLAGANLAGANLNGANLSGVNLAGANLNGANLNGANLTGASLKGVLSNSSTNFNNVTWSNTVCPDGTNSNNDGGTCIGHL
jgi:virginiamycin B lyase